MSADTREILCGKCKAPLSGPADGDSKSVFSCPSCGASDTREEVLRIVAEYFKETTARALQDSMRKAVRGSKFLKLSVKNIPKRDYKFIFDVKS